MQQQKSEKNKRNEGVVPKKDLRSIQNRVFGQKREWSVFDIWDKLMYHYQAWIPLDEFLSLDTEILYCLLDRIEDREKQMKKARKRGGKK